MLFFLTTDPRSSAGCFVERLAMEAGGVIPTRHASGWMEKKDTQRSLACRIVVRNTFREPLSTLGLAVEKRSNKRQRNEFRSTPSGTSGLTARQPSEANPRGVLRGAVHGRLRGATMMPCPGFVDCLHVALAKRPARVRRSGCARPVNQSNG